MMVGTAVESDAAKLRAVGNVLRREGKGGGGLLWGVRVADLLRLREMWRGRGGLGWKWILWRLIT